MLYCVCIYVRCAKASHRYIAQICFLNCNIVSHCALFSVLYIVGFFLLVTVFFAGLNIIAFL